MPVVLYYSRNIYLDIFLTSFRLLSILNSDILVKNISNELTLSMKSTGIMYYQLNIPSGK